MNFDIIIVLAGGIKENGELPESVKHRVQKAKELFDAQLAPRVLMSGRWSSMEKDRHPSDTEAAAMVRYALSIGMSVDSLFLEEESKNTQGNAIYSKQLFLEPNSWKKAMIVTSDFHLKRTHFLFTSIYGPEYTLEFIGAHAPANVVKRTQWRIREKILLELAKKRLTPFSG